MSQAKNEKDDFLYLPTVINKVSSDQLRASSCFVFWSAIVSDVPNKFPKVCMLHLDVGETFLL